MKLYIMAWLLSLLSMTCFAYPVSLNDNNNFDSIFFELHKELLGVSQKYEKRLTEINLKITQLQAALKMTESGTRQRMELFIEKSMLEEERNALVLDSQGEISKIRYKKGLQIIKLLNEKMLSLDHHFSTIKTFNEIGKIANPNNYQEFQKVKEFMKKGNEKKGFEATSLLNSNIYTSIIGTVVNLFISSSNKESEEKTKQMEQISCIIDFTLRMNQDLNTIYYETAFLQSTNNTIKGE